MFSQIHKLAGVSALALLLSVNAAMAGQTVAPQAAKSVGVTGSPWQALHDELTQLSIASEQTQAAKGHVMAVGASVQARSKARTLTPAEIALEQQSRARILDLVARVQQSQKNVARQLAGNQAFIDRHHFSARITARQQAAVGQFNQGSTQLAAVQQKLLAANSRLKNDDPQGCGKCTTPPGAAVAEWHQGLEQLRTLVNQWQPEAPVASAKNTPWTTPHLKVRAPHIDKDDYLQSLSMFGIAPLQVAGPLPTDMPWPVLPTLPEAVQPADTQATIDAPLTPAIQAKAAALNHNPAQIFRWVHDNIIYVPGYGSLQGADFTLQSGRGNDMDTASLLIALLRASNIPARYVYGTIEVPVKQAQNWVGGAPDATAVLSLLAQGGVPSQAVEQGGSITAIRLEHVWVEAFVDYVPSRGTVQQQSDTWVPLDASFKQYQFSAPLNVAGAVPFNAQGLLTQLQGATTINSNGVVQNLNSVAVQQAVNGYQQNIRTWLSNYPGLTAGQIIGNSNANAWPVPLLAKALDYTLVTVAGDFDELPATLRWKFRLNLYGSVADQSNNAPQLTLQGDLPTLLGHRIGIGFRPSTADDQAVLDSLLPQAHANGTPVTPSEYPTNLPAYLINMTAQLYQDGQLLREGNGGFPLGTALTLESAAYDPSSQSWQEGSADTVNAGETHSLSLDAGMSAGLLAGQQALLEQLRAQVAAGNLAAGSYDSLTGVLLSQIGSNYFGLLDAYEQWMLGSQNLVGFRRPSWARIATEVDPHYAQGIIVSASFPGAQLRLDHLESAIVGAGGSAAALPYRSAATERLSLYSQTTLQNSLQTILPNGNPVSAVHALSAALTQGQPLYALNASTYASLSPSIALGAAEAPAVTNAIAIGQQVLLSQNNVTLSSVANAPGAWTGRGLLYQDSATGNSRFTVSNGANTGATALWYDAQGTAWFALAAPAQLQAGPLPALDATRNLNVQLQAALGANQNLAWAQFTPGNDLINSNLLTQFNTQTQGSAGNNPASPNLLPTATGILLTDFALSQGVNLNLSAPPVISSIPGTTASVDVPYSYSVQASSPQGSALSYSVVNGPTLVSFGSGSSGNTLSWSKPLPGSWPLTVRVADGKTFTTQSWTLIVSQGAPALRLSVVVQPQFAAPGAPVTVQLSTTGGRLPEQASLSVDGQPLSLLPGSTNGALDASGSQTSSYIATFTASSTVGNHTLVATVADGNQSLTQSSLYAVNDPADTSAPVVAITSPETDASLTSSVPVVGSVSAANLSYYLLLLKPAGAPDSAYVQIAKGTQSVSNGSLGSLDPSTLQNGLYTLSLVAFNSQGQQSGVQLPLEIEKQLKLGQFHISFADLSLTAPGGMPLQLTRTYDTTRSTQSLDFGYGWSATYQDIIVKKNIPVGQGWQVLTNNQNFQVCLVPIGAHKVAITLPDGSIYNFRASNTTQCQTGATPLPQVQFTAINTTATLTAINIDAPIQQGSNLIDSNTGGPWNPTQFDLKLLDGTHYFLDEHFGIQQIKDRWNNTLTFTQSGIQSSDGQSLSFQRDSSNRITQVTDPSGNSLKYSYDASGNLATVTDRLGNTTTFAYVGAQASNPSLAHYLQSYTDARGITVSRFDYDDSGRLTTSSDSQGRSTTLSYDTQNNRQTSKDKLGNTTVYTYDNDGNIVQKIDALGYTWNYTFDANGNQLTQTDPLGHVTSTAYGSNLADPGTYNKVLSQTDALGHTINTQYNSAGQVLKTTDAKGNSTGYEYFGNGSIKASLPEGPSLSFNVDGYGNTNNLQINGQNIQFTNDASGHVLSQIDATGVATSFSNDNFGNPTASQFSLTSNIGLPTVTTTVVTKRKTYDPNGNVLMDANALGYARSFTYNANNQKLSATDEQGHITRYTYNDSGMLIKTEYPDGLVEASSYDANGNRLEFVDTYGHVTRFEFDGLNRPLKSVFADGSYVSIQYDAVGNRVTIADAYGHKKTTVFDAAGNPVVVTDAKGNSASYSYDENGNATSITASDGSIYQYGYDGLDRLRTVILPGGQSQSVAYDANNNAIATEVDESGTAKQFHYDAAGKLNGVTLTSPTGAVQTTYGYDEAANKAAQTDANNHTTRWQFDVAGLMTGRTLPDGRQEAFKYDSVGNAIQHTAFDGGTLYIAYDVMNRPTLKVWPDGRQVRYTYTLTGNVATIAYGVTAPTVSGYQPTGTTSYAYDVMDRVNKVTYPDGQYISYAYDNVGNLQSRTTANGSWAYTYDPNNNLATVTDPQQKTTSYSYDVNNRLSKTAYPDGTVGYREYDVNGHLLQIAWKNNSNQLLNGTVYTLLPNGQRQTITRYDAGSTVNVTSLSYTNPSTGVTTQQEHWSLSNPASAASYSYDYAKRLSQEQLTDNRNHQQVTTGWTYDKVGNRLSQTKTVTPSGGSSITTTTTYSYDATDRLTQSQDTTGTGSTVTTTYGWDQNGRLTSKTTPAQLTTYRWRADDRLIEVKQGSNINALQTIASYQYDDNGNRTQRAAYVQDPTNPNGPLVAETTNYLVDENYTYAETLEETKTSSAGQSARTQYTWDDSNHVISASGDSGNRYYEHDGLGSVITLSDSTGNPTQAYSYTAFGETSQANQSDSNPYRYTGEYADQAIAMQYNRARWYNERTNVFIAMDAYPASIMEPQKLNRYTYVTADPINFIDPQGLYTQQEGVRAETYVCFAYWSAYPSAGQAFACGGRVYRRVPLGGALVRYLKPDIFDVVRLKYAEVKPLSPAGIAAGAAQIQAYDHLLGGVNGSLYSDEYYSGGAAPIVRPFTREKIFFPAPYPLLDGGRLAYFLNYEGLIFYTDSRRLMDRALQEKASFTRVEALSTIIKYAIEQGDRSDVDWSAATYTLIGVAAIASAAGAPVLFLAPALAF